MNEDTQSNAIIDPEVSAAETILSRWEEGADREVGEFSPLEDETDYSNEAEVSNRYGTNSAPEKDDDVNL